MIQKLLNLQILTPDGRSLNKEGVEAVVFRRKERRFELGSEMAVLPGHAPTLVRIPVAPLRYRKGEKTSFVVLGGDFVEVKKNRVSVLTPRFETIRLDEPRPALQARHIAEDWRREERDFRKEMIGYL